MNPQRKREPVILTVPEVAALADVYRRRLKAAILASAWCGVRWGELIELRRKDIEVPRCCSSARRDPPRRMPDRPTKSASRARW